MFTFIINFCVPLRKLWHLSKLTTEDLRRTFREEKEVWDFYYPYIAERQSGFMAMVCGGWLIAAHGVTFHGPAYVLIRHFISQNQLGWGLFLTGSIHAMALYAYNRPCYRFSDLPTFGRRFSLFIETIWWSFLALLFLGGLPAGLNFALFGNIGFGSYRAFQYTGNRKQKNKGVVHE